MIRIFRFFILLPLFPCLTILDFYPRLLQTKGIFKKYDRGGEVLAEDQVSGRCRKFSPTFQEPISKDFVGDFSLTEGWVYNIPDYTIKYMGMGEATIPKPKFKFWKKPRFNSQFSLLRKDFWCESTTGRVEVKLNGAEAAGVMFRVRGTFDFWAVMLLKSGNVELIQVVQGEKKVLLSEKYLIQDWTALVADEMIGDVDMYFGPDFENLKKIEWKLQKFDEVEDEQQGAAGLIAWGGPAMFRTFVLGEVEWAGTPEKVKEMIEEDKKQDKTSGHKFSYASILANLLKYKEDLKVQYCPPLSYCSKDPMYRIE
eukprot:GHVP01033201.1.p1 GENE.GHVP01033201.1~~GHVP01033201.1.p1  ORF type:complete len:312 (+),score=46.41 GHVP01033201.1:549-1484(+)